jgi:tetratricopeptide (TPR) repeat protein/DNA-binding transcriptional ArsR family regulator
MKGFLSHYTPSLMNPEDLDAIFVQRDRLLNDLLENIENSILTEAKHHALLIGPRGIGKTHLISMIYHRVSANETFKDKLKIAWLREEEWGVATFLDLLVRILNSLMEEYKDPNLEEQVKGLYSVSTEQAEQLAGYILRQYCHDQTLLLLMENLDEIFKGLDESGQQAFRAYLQNYGFITIVATSQSLFKGVQSRNLPFYGFFSPTHLKPLVLEEAIALLANIAKWRGEQKLADLLITPLGKSRIRAIHHLAGGNHRIYIIFSQFLTTESLDSLVEPFMKTLDDLTPFYQSRMQFISPQQRKIIQYLCEQPGKFSVKEIAQHCFISPQTASSQLKQLRELGYIYADSEGRESFYELQEPLMRIWLEAKKCKGTSNQLFISFLRVWFSHEELKNRLKILPLETNFDRECTPQALLEMETSTDPNISALLKEWDDAWKNSKYEKMLELSKKLIFVRGSGLDWIKQGQSYFHLDEISIAIECFDKAITIEPNNHEIWQLRGLGLYKIELFSKSLFSYEKAIELNSKNALTWSQKALVEAKMEYEKQAIYSIERAITLDQENNEIWGNALLVYTIIKYKEYANQCLEKILKIDSYDDKILQNLALSLKDIDIEAGIKCINKAININKKSSESYRILAILYLFKKDNRQALDAIKKSIDLCKTNNILWYTKAAILIQMKLFTDATKSLHECIKLEEDFSNKTTKGVASSSKNTLKLWMKKHLLIYIFKLGNELKNWLEESQSMLEIYGQHHLLNDLSGGLVESIKAINEPSTSDHTAQAWLEMWQNLAGQYDEFQVALNLLKVAVEYKINRDRRVLLQLPQEERQILEELLNPEIV